MFAGKALRCDCGYAVRASDDAAFVGAIRQHARATDGIEFSVGLALEVARRALLTPSEREELELELEPTKSSERS